MQNGIKKRSTKEDFLNILESEKSGGSISLAAKLSGISRQTVYNLRREDFEFDDAVVQAAKEGKIVIADLAEQALIKRIISGDTTAIIFALKNLRSRYYGENVENRFDDETKRSGEIAGDPKTLREAELMVYLWFGTFKYKLKNLNSPEMEELCTRVQKAMKGT